MKKRIQRISDIVILSLTIALGGLFIISLLNSYRKSNLQNRVTIHENIVKESLRYIEDEFLIQRGEKLDCSSFTRVVYSKQKIDIPTSALEQYQEGLSASTDEIKAGDLVFFQTLGNRISHVGIYLGDSVFIHSPGKNKIVRKDSLTMTYWKERLVGYRTYIEPSVKKY